jgi:LysR family hydrogen peroxide-inducible transcriptional activator
MEIHQLRYFVAVVEVGSFSGAARRCNVAQPSLSQQVIKLEDELGYKLFDRLGRSIALTEAGEALLPRARRILAEIHDAAVHLADELEAGRGSLSVGAIPTIAPFLLPRAIQRFARACPEAKLTIVEDMTPRLIEAIVAAELDLALLSNRVDNDAVDREVLFDERLLVVVGRNSPFARQKTFGLRDLDDQPTVLLDEMHCLGQQVQEFCRAMRVQHLVACRATQLATVLRLVELDLGVGLVPEMAASADRSAKRVYLEVQGGGPRREIAVISRAGRSRSLLAQRFVECVRADVPATSGRGLSPKPGSDASARAPR